MFLNLIAGFAIVIGSLLSGGSPEETSRHAVNCCQKRLACCRFGMKCCQQAPKKVCCATASNCCAQARACCNADR